MTLKSDSNRHEPASRSLHDDLGLGTPPSMKADTHAPELSKALADQLSSHIGQEAFSPPADPYGGRGISLALGAHLLLLAMLFFSLQWSTKPPVALQAELWTSLPSTSQDTPAPTVVPERVPEPVVEPSPPVTKEKPAPVKPDIALEDLKKKKKPEKEPVKPIEPKKPEPKPEPKPVKKPEAKPEPKKPDVTDAALNKLRDEEMKRALAAAGGSSGPVNATVNAAGVKGDLAYSDKIRAKILGNIVFNLPSDLSGNPEVIFVVDQLPTGEIISLKKTKSSGLAAWDDAVERAIRKSDPLPKNKDGAVVRQLEISFRPKDSR